MEFLSCLPGLRCQLGVVAIEVGLIAMSIAFGGAGIYHALRAHKSRPQIVERMKADMAVFGWKMTDDEVWLMFSELIVIGLQHLLGGFLILPALLGLVNPIVAGQLAIVGALSEVAYDLYDSARSLFRYYVRGNLPGGQKALKFLLLHHQLSMLLVVPLNVYYGANRYYLHMVFNLMGAGGFALFVSHAGQMLDLHTRRDLLVMRALTTVQFLIMAYTRVVAYIPLCAILLATTYADRAWLLLSVGTLALGAMGVFNAMLLPSTYNRMRKFWRLSEQDFAAASKLALACAQDAGVLMEVPAKGVLCAEHAEEPNSFADRANGQPESLFVAGEAAGMRQRKGGDVVTTTLPGGIAPGA